MSNNGVPSGIKELPLSSTCSVAPTVLSSLPSVTEPVLQAVVHKYRDIVCPKDRLERLSKLPPVTIRTEGPPVKECSYRQSPQVREVTEREVEQMLKDNIIQPSEGPYAMNVVIVKKKDGTEGFALIIVL